MMSLWYKHLIAAEINLLIKMTQKHSLIKLVEEFGIDYLHVKQIPLLIQEEIKVETAFLRGLHR